MAITMPMLIFDVLVSIRTIKINDEIEETDLLKIINGIEPSIILAFSVFCDKAVHMYSNYRKKRNSHPFLNVCL